MIMNKNNTAKIFCGAFLGIAFVYGLVLPFMWGNNPMSETGTLSLLCEDRKLFFWIWGILTSGSIILNTKYLYKRYDYKNKIFDAFCVMGFISMCCVALTLGHSIADWNPKRLLHWIATGVFIVFTVAPILLFFIKNIKKFKGFKACAVITLLILGTFIFIFAVIGKSALMEMVPIALIEAFLFVLNFTSLLKIEEKELEKRGVSV